MAAPKSQAKSRARSSHAGALATPVSRGPSAETSCELRTSEAESAGRYEIAKLVAAEPDYKVLFSRMMEVTKRFVDFDWANLFVYSSKREYSRMVCWYGPCIEYPMRWFEIDPPYRGWIDQAETWMKDLKEDLLNGPAPRLLERPDVKIAVAAGTKALIALPVREGGEIKGGICLLSQLRDIYCKETREVLERLMLDQALLAVFHAAERAETLFVSDLVKEIADAKDLRDLARTVVTDFGRFYGFENTAIFKVNMLRKRFELLAQELGFEGGTRMLDTDTQPLDKGLLGLSYRRGAPILVNNVNDGSEESQHYFSFTPEMAGNYEHNEMRSELCIPIRLFGRILWIFNVEDRRIGAFNAKEVETLQGVFQQMQVMLERMFQRDILFQVLDMLPDGLVILEQNGIVIRSNREANRMFQRDNAEGVDIGRFFADPDAKVSFTAERAAPSMTTVKGERGKETPVLISKFTLPEEYDHVVLMLQDVSKLQWKTDFEGLKAALAESVEQVRVPISLLASYVQQIERRVDDEKLRDLTRKALRQLGRVELTYDRMLASYNAQALPPAVKVSFDINSALEHILNDLPKLERGAVSLTTASPAIANVDPYRVMFALNSMLAYLLRARTNTERIAIYVRTADGTLEVAMTGAVHPTSPQGELATLIENTRTQIALGQDALERIAQECEGSFERTRQAGGRERLSLRLAAAH
jgi:putative methionine-R-sulfoxide reductase with GAF domain